MAIDPLTSTWKTPEQRRQLGQARRKEVARQQHAEFSAKARKIPANTLLRRASRGRIPALVRLKYERMMASPFGYFRGAVPVMAADLAAMPDTGLQVQLCGDAHVRNLGAYAAEDGKLIFDINDFDETVRGPFEWDLKRMAASLIVAGCGAGNKSGACARAVERCMSTYSEMMAAYAEMPVLDMVRHQISRIQDVAPIHEALTKAMLATPMHTLEKLTEPAPNNTSGARQFRHTPPLLSRVAASTARAVLASLEGYKRTLEPQRRYFLEQYRPVDVAFKVVGTGSVGLRDYCVYLEGKGAGDPLFIQIKEEAESAYAPYLKIEPATTHQGQRVVDGQRWIQRGSDPFLGYTTIESRGYLVRQLNDHKASIALEDLTANGLLAYAQVCGELLARGHARSGDACEISGYIGTGEGFSAALAEFGRAYADQTERDWKVLRKSMTTADPTLKSSPATEESKEETSKKEKSQRAAKTTRNDKPGKAGIARR